VSDEKWNSKEVFGDTQDIIVDAILTHPPCTFIIIGEERDPDVGETYAKFIVPQWGEA
tara:strand:+ start:246 stop:419 length:174 start_codon:yes stop_codon:yes gene_type:complete